MWGPIVLHAGKRSYDMHQESNSSDLKDGLVRLKIMVETPLYENDPIRWKSKLEHWLQSYIKFCCIMIILSNLLFELGSSPIDVTDPRWESYLLIQKKTDQQGNIQSRLLGFTAVYTTILRVFACG